MLSLVPKFPDLFYRVLNPRYICVHYRLHYPIETNDAFSTFYKLVSGPGGPKVFGYRRVPDIRKSRENPAKKILFFSLCVNEVVPGKALSYNIILDERKSTGSSSDPVTSPVSTLVLLLRNLRSDHSPNAALENLPAALSNVQSVADYKSNRSQ